MKNSLVLGLCVSVGLLGALITPGCGGDSDSDGTPAAGAGGLDAGTGGTGATGGSAGASTGGSGGSTGGSGGSGGGTGGTGGGPMSAMCAGMTCDGVATGLGVDINACCAGAGMSKCALDLSPLAALGVNLPDPCLERNAPGNLDSSCPDLSLMGITAPGCCLPTGVCGNVADLTQLIPNLNLGCVNPGMFVDAGTPMNCTPMTGTGGAGGMGAGGMGAGGMASGGMGGTP